MATQLAFIHSARFSKAALSSLLFEGIRAGLGIINEIMPLIDFWKSNPEAVGQLSISQIVSAAGDGHLRDSSTCSSEIREYLLNITSEKLSDYIEQCLANKIEKGGMILQDLINELGRRLDYKVRNGRYQGVSNDIGFDGLWQAPEGNSIIVEVKTSDAYRVSLDTIVSYKARAIEKEILTSSPSILIVVGRQDTGELEAQVRGSRHAWDIRLIRAESLIKLVILKENSGEPETDLKIRSILTPLEYTRLDRLVDVMFTAATDASPTKGDSITSEDESDENDTVDLSSGSTSSTEKPVGIWDFTEPQLLAAQRVRAISAISKKLNVSLIKQSRALFWDKDHRIRVACTISKRYVKRPTIPYWYAHHPKWDDFLQGGDQGFLILGCMDLDVAFSVPINEFHKIMSKLHITDNEKGKYWHIHLTSKSPGRYEIVIPRSTINFDLRPFEIELVL